ncbi:MULTISPECIES: carbohydrate ABC transporter permease [Isoptericola]|uniref:Sugar ABC transporter permease n=1 Tax=Isoptericola sediminis TaxID=2733572 RepID=A0A849KA41_9MICO|nr:MULTISPECIES: sugar ABC transporter permease [Isoptericola]MDO8144090.1 sugar ABC transporter permease [Isoptericola sp. 178]MDO8147941.1 sugar ABC transporter permease [Isoptericola sp. b515]MDO8152666.1 sugar ABC transporter permease [Isoptericola sp. b408]NNU28107.1 sugar ABC transporter permease [Isoptericola sediminis]
MALMSPTRPAHSRGNPDRPSRRIGFSQRLGRLDVKVSPYLYISPFFLLFAVVGLFPLGYTAVVSVYEWNLLGGQGDFVGMQNYVDVLQQPTFWKSVGNTFSIFLLSSVPQVIMAITIAALLDQNLRAATFWRMGVLVPFIVAPVAISMIFGRLFADQYGFINELIGLVGLEPIAWHGDRLASHVAIATMVNYRWTGYNTLIFLAAMQAVPRDLYEAAVIDGAGRVRQFFSVTVPQIRATIIFVVITSTVGGMQIFDEVRMYDAGGLGGPNRDWMTTVVYLYDVAWGNQKNFGRAAAVAWLLFLLIVMIGMVNFLVTQRISTAGPKQSKVSRKHTKRLLAEARAAGAPGGVRMPPTPPGAPAGSGIPSPPPTPPARPSTGSPTTNSGEDLR